MKLAGSGGAPKISLAQSAFDILQHHLEFYGGAEHSPHNRDLLQDSDEFSLIWKARLSLSKKPEYLIEDVDKHRSTLVVGLTKSRGMPDIGAKHEWAAPYHNLVCEDFQKQRPVPVDPDADEVYVAAAIEAECLSDYLIDLEPFAPAPGRLKLAAILPDDSEPA